MGSRATPSFEDLSAAVEAIYDAAMDEVLWPCALKRLADLLGGNCAAVALETAADASRSITSSATCRRRSKPMPVITAG